MSSYKTKVGRWILNLGRSEIETTMKVNRSIIYTIVIITFLIAVKVIWMSRATRYLDTVSTEFKDVEGRLLYLHHSMNDGPEELLANMPSMIGPQFQGEWALYTCSMLSTALTNLCILYPEHKTILTLMIRDAIEVVLSPELREYDTERWGEDALETLDGDVSHISYLSHLAWMISGYKQSGGDERYDELYSRLCETMNRRILASPILNIQTYPREYIYVPDMLVAIVALANYSRQNNGEYCSTVDAWLNEIKTNWIDEESGLIRSYIPDGEVWIGILPAIGSYSALSCYYLTFIDEEFAKEQYELLKKNFYKNGLIKGFKEHYDKDHRRGFNIDAGPILLGLSPTGTAFAIGPATYFEDWEVRNNLLHTAELAGFTVHNHGLRHYLLANIAIVGEAITLAMRTAVKWE